MLRKLFAYLYDRGMRRTERNLLGYRRAALLGDISGEILEIGSGTGINFQYYNPEARVTALEPSIYMSEQSLSRVGKKDIQIYTTTIAGYMETVEESFVGFDYIVCTLVLCSIPEYELEIERLQGLLKPGGQILVLEHIASKNRYISFFQRLFTPMQKCLADGCHLDRQTDEVFRESSLECMYEEYFGRGNVFYVANYGKNI